MSDLIGQSLGRYHVLQQLGEGGMAIVYKAYDASLEREVAIKVIRRGAFPPDQLDNLLKRFEREAKALAKLSHPNIVRVLDYGEHEGSPYLVMEYLPGGTLKYQLGKPIPWHEAVSILLPIAEALQYAHEHNIIHRDIKPANILMTEKGRPMLTDFGIAKILEREEVASLTGSGMIMGTPEYMAPEQWTGQTSERSDIYSLAVVLYEMVTGRKPYVADTPAAILLKQASDPLPRPTAFTPDLPDEIEQTLLKALAKTANDRYQNMHALIAALKESLTHKVPSQTEHLQIPQTLAERSSQAPQTKSIMQTAAPRSSAVKSVWLWAVAGLIVLGIAGIVVLVGIFTRLNGLSNVPPSATMSLMETSTYILNSTSTSLPTEIIQRANTSLPTPILQPSATNPPNVIIPYFTASQGMFCYDAPDVSSDTHWELNPGQVVVVLAKWSEDINWLAVDINEPAKTRTDCCWVTNNKGTLNIGLDQIKRTNIVPDRLDCSAIQ